MTLSRLCASTATVQTTVHHCHVTNVKVNMISTIVTLSIQTQIHTGIRDLRQQVQTKPIYVRSIDMFNLFYEVQQFFNDKLNKLSGCQTNI